MEYAYSEDFFLKYQDDSLRSAREIIPLLLQFIKPNSVIDVGCATGAWLSVFKEHGIQDILGLDGHASHSLLLIGETQYRQIDLSTPFELGRKADLALSLEVAEHLPAECAVTFIQSLVKIASVILFSAAIPGQGGTNHRNEQWPEYWAELFCVHGYIPIDCLRLRIWRNERIKFWFRQNILIYADEKSLDCWPQLKSYVESGSPPPLSLVHPELYTRRPR